MEIYLRKIHVPPLIAVLIFFILKCGGLQILSKSKLERCEKLSDGDELECTQKLVINMAVPSGSSGREASIVAELAETENVSTGKMQTLRASPIITVEKSAAYALYEITYIRDVAYKPEELYVKTRKCKPDADAKVVKECVSLKDEKGQIIQQTVPICCPCGSKRRVPSSCGNFVDKLMKGKANTAHCLRFPGEWFHVFTIGRRLLGFSVRIEVKKGLKKSEVVIGPANRTVLSADNFLRVSLIGDFTGYTSIPTFEDFYLVIPREGGPGKPSNLGSNFPKWMLLERVRFSLDGLECNKIGVSYEAYNGQPGFCSSPLGSCLHYQLWNFWESDQNRINRSQAPQYVVERRFERINQHPNAGTHSFSIGITEVLNTNILIELTADDIEYVYQRSPGNILNIAVPTFEALSQFGAATITTMNIGELEASYSLTFHCLEGINPVEEQFFIMKPGETVNRTFKLSPTTDKAAEYRCIAILKDSNYNEADRAECQFVTTATVVDQGAQITSTFEPTDSNGFFGTIKSVWKNIWDGFMDFITGKRCRSNCSGFFDVGCHIQYICLSWIVLFGLFLALFPLALLLLWLLHQKGFFDPLRDWWDDHVGGSDLKQRKYVTESHLHRRKGYHPGRPHKQKGKNYHRDTQDKLKTRHNNRNHLEHIIDQDNHRHRIHKDKHIAEHAKERNPSTEKKREHHLYRMERQGVKRLVRTTRHGEDKQEKHSKHKHIHKKVHN